MYEHQHLTSPFSFFVKVHYFWWFVQILVASDNSRVSEGKTQGGKEVLKDARIN
jgi:hypothetical protein